MGTQMQNLSNQMTPPTGTSANPQPTTLPQYPTIGSNPTNNQSQSGIPAMPMGKGNTTNSATSGQPQMGMPNTNMQGTQSNGT
jgi:hypothetical protein